MKSTKSDVFQRSFDWQSTGDRKSQRSPWSPRNIESDDPLGVDLSHDWIFKLLKVQMPDLAADHDARPKLWTLFQAAMDYGWNEAISYGPTATKPAQRKAIQVRRDQTARRYATVRAAFKRASAAGNDVNIEQIARECGVSRATAYRALRPKSS